MANLKYELFDTEHLKTDLKNRAVKSVGITVAAQLIKLVLQLASISILARLLQPSDYGLIAMVSVFTGLAHQFAEGGLSMATIQRSQITHAQVSNLFWVNCILGLGLFLLGILISPLIAIIYDEPRLIMIMSVLSFSFFIGSLSVQHDALLRRQMRFKLISIIDVLSMALGIVAGVLAAYNGFGYWSLIVSSLITVLLKTTLRWINLRWIPTTLSKGSGVRPLLNFGANLTGANFIGYFSKNITAFSVGLVGGPQILGIYNRANALAGMPTSQLMPPIMNVMQPALSRVKDNPEKLKKASLSLLTKLAIVTMLITVILYVTADWLILLFLGKDWVESIEIFRILAISSLVTPITAFTAIIMVAVGEARALMRWKAITFSILTVSILIGSFWGPLGIVLAHCLSGLFIRMPGFLFYSTKYQPIRILDYITSLMPVFFSAFISLISLMYLRCYLEFDFLILSILTYTCLSGCMYFLLLFCFARLRSEIFESIILFKKLLFKSK